MLPDISLVKLETGLQSVVLAGKSWVSIKLSRRFRIEVRGLQINRLPQVMGYCPIPLSYIFDMNSSDQLLLHVLVYKALSDTYTALFSMSLTESYLFLARKI